MFWTCDTGIAGQAPVDLDELALVWVDRLLSYIPHRAWPTSPRRLTTKGQAQAGSAMSDYVCSVGSGSLTGSGPPGSMWQRAGDNRVRATTFRRETGGDGDA